MDGEKSCTRKTIEWYILLQIPEKLQFLQVLFFCQGVDLEKSFIHFLGGVKTPHLFSKEGGKKATLRPWK